MEAPVQLDRVLERAQKGDRDAYRELVEHYWSPVLRWLQGMSHCAHAAEDLAQEVFLKAWIGLPSFHIGNHFTAWLFRIARNCWIDRQRQQPPVPLQPLPGDVAAAAADPHIDLQNKENSDMLQQACAQLPESYRSAFLLWTLNDLPYSRIAEILDVTEETARWRVCKARKLLLLALGRQLDRKPKP